MKTLVTVLLILSTLATQAQITSTFDVDADGWTFFNGATGASLPPNFKATGGNPGGYVDLTYSSNTAISVQSWIAPSKFLGDQLSRSFGMNLIFSLQQSIIGTNSNSNGDIRIENGGTVLVYSFPSKPATAPGWTTYTIRLDETQNWRIGSTTGAIATRAQVIQVLTNITAIEIRGTYASNATYTSALDEVTLQQRTLASTPSILSFSPEAAKPGVSISITGTGFDPSISNNAVYFGSVAGTISSASATSLQVTVPVSAQFGPITIINKTTGTNATSKKSFNPLFDGGGRIIPASFKSSFTLDMTGGYGGVVCADMDGDGKPDIVAAADDNSAIRVFRNIHSSGSLSAASFATPQSFATLLSGANGAGLKVIDLDNDGKLDMVTSGFTGGSGVFATFRNTSTPGNISFEPVEAWNGASDESPANGAADIDGDGRIDLVSGEGSSPGSTWIIQNISTPGNIEFGYRKTVSLAGNNSHQGVSLGDLNNDGKPELIHKIQNVGNQQNIYVNTSTPGTISFGATVTIPNGIQGGMVIYDFNQDGLNDLAWKDGNASDDIRIRINTNTGGALSLSDFATEVVLDSETGFYGGLNLGDMNGDGKVDLLVTDASYSGIFESAYSGGTLTAQSFIAGFLFNGLGGSTYPSSPQACDLNGDMKPELIMGVTNLTLDKLVIYENINVASPVISINTISPLNAPIGSTVTITGSNFSATANNNLVYFGSLPATVLTATATQLTVTVPAGAGHDLVTVRVGELSSTYHLPFHPTFSAGVNFNGTHFATPISISLAGANYDIEAVDMDQDGKPDIAAEAGTGQTFFFRNTFSSGSITTSSLTASGSTASGASNPKFLDIEGNGSFDLVSTNGLMYSNNSSSGSISFGPQLSLGIGVANLATGDLNKDGKLDLTAPNNGTAQLLMIENRSTPGPLTAAGIFGSFANNIPVGKPSTGGGVATGDFDADGYTDVITTNPGTDNLSIYRNPGATRIITGAFSLRTEIATGDNPGRIYTGDFDDDKKLDFVFYHNAGANPTRLTIFHNQSTPGNISFTSFDLTNPGNLTVAHIADMDGDGKPEILTTSESGNLFSIFKNIHSGGALSASSFAAPFNTTVTGPRGITTGDLNLDGKPEIIITRAAGLLLVYENLIPKVVLNITQQPVNPNNRCEGLNFTFSTDAIGASNISYQWQKYNSLTTRFENLSDGTVYSGTTTKNLLITNVQAAQAGDYRCLVLGDYASPAYCNIGTLTVNPTPAPPAVTGAARCDNGSVTLTASGTTDGNYIWYGSNGKSEPLAGENNSTYTTPILNSTTDYYVSIVNSFCESALVQVIATITPATGPTVANASRCSPGALTLSATGGTNGQYRWYTTASGGTAIAGETNSTYTTPSLTTSTTYYVSINNGTCESARVAVTASISAIPADPAITSVSRCGAGAITLTASGGATGEYRWYSTSTGGTAIAGETNASYSISSLSTTTTYYVAINNGTCESNRVAVTAAVNPVPGNPVVSNAARCGPGAITLNASGGSAGEYRWYTAASGGTAIAGETNASYPISSLSSTTTYYVAITNGTCESNRMAIIATVNPLPAKPIITASGSTTLCSGQTVTLTAPAGFTYAWSTGATTQQIVASTSGSFTVTVNNGTCSNTSDPLVITSTTCNQPPTITTSTGSTTIAGNVSINLSQLLSDPDNNLDLSTLKIVTPPKSGASATITGQTLVINYSGIAFAGTDELTIEVCDTNGACAQQKITIEVIGDIIPFNGISNNGDDKNPSFFIQYIDVLPDTRQNKVTIFNRWGDVVWEGVNYDNRNVVFTGKNKNGNDLPAGTYFYKIEFNSNRPVQSGYLSLKR